MKKKIVQGLKAGLEFMISAVGFNFVILLNTGDMFIGLQAMKRFFIQWILICLSFSVLDIAIEYLGMMLGYLPMSMLTLFLMWQYIICGFALTTSIPILVGQKCNLHMMNSLVKVYEEKTKQTRQTIKHR